MVTTFDIKRLDDGYWYLFINDPRYSKTMRMGGYATEKDANEMKDFIAGEMASI